MNQLLNDKIGATKRMITYWRNCIADCERMDVPDSRLKTAHRIEIPITFESLPQPETDSLFKEMEDILMSKRKENDKPVEVAQVPIIISPLSIIVPVMHGQRKHSKVKPVKHLMWIPANLAKDGTLSPSKTLKPWISRDLMEPLPIMPHGNTIDLIIGDIRQLDEFLTKNEFDGEHWNEYVHYCSKMFKSVSKLELEIYFNEDYTIDRSLTVLIDNNVSGTNEGISKVYDYLSKIRITPPLLDRYTSVESPDTTTLLQDMDIIDQSARHIGQMGFEYPLSPSQRQALYHFQQIGDGEILAINGPPGTGKTTLLQNIVATTIVDYAIKGDKPPVIAISSTNNQAIDNVIESFGNAATRPGKLAGRWLPDINSFALFLPATTKKIPDGTHYTTYDGSGLPNTIQTPEYCHNARILFLEKCSDFADEKFKSISDAVSYLRKQLLNTVNEIENASSLIKDYLQKKKILDAYLEFGGSEFYRKELERQKKKSWEIIAGLESLSDEWLKETRSRSWISRLMVKLRFKSLIAKQEARNRLILTRSPIPIDCLHDFSEESVTDFITQSLSDQQSLRKGIYEKHHQLKDDCNNYDTALKKWQNWQEAQQILEEPPGLFDRLDTSLRHRAFQLAVHYWEGRWLEEVNIFLTDPNSTGKGRKKMEAQWYRYAMLTPCFVSTFFMLPKFFKYSRHDSESGNFQNIPHLSFIDLLIVDEAGQTLVETGGASFALAKKAVTVGDIFQIQPVRQMTYPVDVGNLIRYGLLKDGSDEHGLEVLKNSGLATLTGSVMKAAQNASSYQIPQISEKGMFLAEHRRCYDEIIEYCNQLTYKGNLIPLRGNSEPGLSTFPAMGYANINSRSQRSGGSRKNPIEASAIAEWLKSQTERIKKHYGSVEDTIGIVTPFAAQKYEIIKALREKGFETEKMKIGTVHALQGAERAIVIFSPVYGYDERSIGFIDNQVYLLNVAVSRAKDSFLVFGNMCLLDPAKNSPTGLLARHLFAEPLNELQGFVPAKRKGQMEIEHISTVDRHCFVLKRSLQKASAAVVIVSPYISINTIEYDNLAEEIEQAVKRGVAVTVYTDRNLDIKGNRLKEFAQKGREKLKEVGAHLIIAQGIHNKTLCVDDKYLVEGSFNWLSSPRDQSHPYFLHNASLSYRGGDVAQIIQNVIGQMEQLAQLGK